MPGAPGKIMVGLSGISLAPPLVLDEVAAELGVDELDTIELDAIELDPGWLLLDELAGKLLDEDAMDELVEDAFDDELLAAGLYSTGKSGLP